MQRVPSSHRLQLRTYFEQDVNGGARGGRDHDVLFEGLEYNDDGRHDGGGQSVVGRRADRRVRQPIHPHVRVVRMSRHGRQLRRHIARYRDNR